jgi:predicted Kef-type K+ transport protein
MTTAHLFGALGVVVIVVIPAFLAGRTAQRKCRPFWLYLIAGFVFGPLALLAAFILPRRGRLV